MEADVTKKRKSRAEISDMLTEAMRKGTCAIFRLEVNDAMNMMEHATSIGADAYAFSLERGSADTLVHVSWQTESRPGEILSKRISPVKGEE